MDKQMKTRVLVFEYFPGLASTIRDVLELDDYLVLETEDPTAAIYSLDTFCPNAIVLGYYPNSTREYQDLLERCQLNYPIIYLTFGFEEALLPPLLSRQNRILTKPFDCDYILVAIEELSQ